MLLRMRRCLLGPRWCLPVVGGGGGRVAPGPGAGWAGPGTGLAGHTAGRPGSGLARPVVGPVDRVLDRISRAGRFSLLFFPKPKPNRPNRRETMELEAQSWGNSRSSTTTPDPRTKTTQNATKSQIGQEANWGYFWGFFGKFSRKEIGWVEGQIRGNQEL